MLADRLQENEGVKKMCVFRTTARVWGRADDPTMQGAMVSFDKGQEKAKRGHLRAKSRTMKSRNSPLARALGPTAVHSPTGCNYRTAGTRLFHFDCCRGTVQYCTTEVRTAAPIFYFAQ